MNSDPNFAALNAPRTTFSREMAVYSGTFDPITLGHIDLIQRAARFFSTVIIAVAKDPAPSKSPFFSQDERLEMIRHIFKSSQNIKPLPFDGLLAQFMKNMGANLIIRGIRNMTDFENECKMAHVNQNIAQHFEHRIETFFLAPSETTRFISSSMVKETHRLGASIESWVHPYVLAQLDKKIKTMLHH